MSWPFRRADAPAGTVEVRIRRLEVPPLTEAKSRIAEGEVARALLEAYPRVLADLGRAYHLEIPDGFTHDEIRGRSFTEGMRPLRPFFDELYQLYAPVRFGDRPADGAGPHLLELLHSLYAADPMWQLYLAERPRGSPDTATTGPDRREEP